MPSASGPRPTSRAGTFTKTASMKATRRSGSISPFRTRRKK